MAANSQRPSAFSTHRGRRVRNTLLTLFGLSLLVLFVSNASGGQGSEISTATANSGTTQTVRPPGIKPPISDVFASLHDVDDSGSSADAEMFTTIRAMAQDTAVAYGTYSYQQTPDRFVGLVPNLADGVKDRLLEQAKVAWPSITASKVAVSAVGSRTAPKVTAYAAEKGTVSVIVTLTQAITMNGQSQTRQESFQVDMIGPQVENGFPVDGSPTEWRVTGITSV